MRKKFINLIIQIVTALLLSGCGNNQKHSCLILPNGDLLKCATISEFDSLYGLTYQQYQGFIGVIEDEYLKEFTVLIEDQASKVGRDVASDEYIVKLKKENVVGLRFNKIPDSIMCYIEVLKYVSACYPKLNINESKSNLEAGIDKEMNYINENNEVVVKVQYSKLGISGSFLILRSMPCK